MNYSARDESRDVLGLCHRHEGAEGGVMNGRPPAPDEQIVREIVAKIGRGVPLHVALARFCKVDKDRVRRKVRRKLCVETIDNARDAVKGEA